MIPTTSRTPTRTAGAVFAAVLLAIAAAVGVAAPAQAHDQIISTSPSEDGHVDTAPAEVSMVYTDSLIEVGAVVLVMDDTEKDWADGPVALDGPNAVQAIKAGMPDGIYQVRWRVVSSDGHPISGVYDFAVGTATLTADTGTETGSNTQAAADPAAAGPDEGTASGATSTTRTVSSTVVIGLLGAVAGVAVFGGVLWFRSRRTS
ncbi:copper resistance CopC family protein [Frigoribacterium sp. CFBP 8751]|uniref:copper resistance CopC family protein n=1 Tax=Frigoribacterium sp. CFBP 8751 TaxID=2775277 RepID=UPI001781B67C|nr:copper resistance CopC family protein [Frigoribacterium sp. CFBP 8751]MBD8540561.1 copper resistance protein CopC [Frigoribacterium sp. CFBP 8751]